MADAPNTDLFGQPIDEFKSMKDKLGCWPVTVWDCDLSDPTVRQLKAAIGDVDTGAGRVKKSAISYTHGMKSAGRLKLPSRDDGFSAKHGP